MIVSFEENFKKDLRREDNTIKISKCILVTKDNINFDIEFEVLQDNKFLNLSFNLEDNEDLVFNRKTEDDSIEVEKIEVYYSLVNEALGFTISNEDSTIPLSQCRNLFCLELPEGKAGIKCNSKLCTDLESYGLDYGQKLEDGKDLNPAQPVSKNSYLRYFRILLDKDTKKTSQNFLDTYGNCGIERVKTEYSNFKIYCLNISSEVDGVYGKDYYVMGLNKGGDILRIQGTVDCAKSYYIGEELVRTETTTIPIEKVPALTLSLTNSENAQFSVEEGCALTISYPRYQHITDSCVVTGNIYAGEKILKSNKIFLYYLDNLVEDNIVNNYYWEKNQKVVCLDGNKGATREITLKCFDYEHVAGTCNVNVDTEIYKYFDLEVTMEPKKEDEDWATCKIKITTKQDNTEGKWIPRIEDIDPYAISLDFSLPAEEGGVGFKNTYDFYLIQLPLTTFDIVGVTSGSSNKYIKIKGNDIEVLADEQNSFNVYDEKMVTGEDHRYYLIRRNDGSIVNCKLNYSNEIINSKTTGGSSYSATIEGYEINDFNIVRDLSGIVIYQVKKDTKIEDITTMPWRELADIRQKNYTFTVKPNYKDFKVLLRWDNGQGISSANVGNLSSDNKDYSLNFNSIDVYHLKAASNFPVKFRITGNTGDVKVEIGNSFSSKSIEFLKPKEKLNELPIYRQGSYLREDELFFKFYLFLSDVKYQDKEYIVNLEAIYTDSDGEDHLIKINCAEGDNSPQEKLPIKIKIDERLNDFITFYHRYLPFNDDIKENLFYYVNYDSLETKFFQNQSYKSVEKISSGDNVTYNDILVLKDGITDISIRSVTRPLYQIGLPDGNNEFKITFTTNSVSLLNKDMKINSGSTPDKVSIIPGSANFGNLKITDELISDYAGSNLKRYALDYMKGGDSTDSNNSPYQYIHSEYLNKGYRLSLSSEARNNYYPFEKGVIQVLYLYPRKESVLPPIDESRDDTYLNTEKVSGREEAKKLFLIPAGVTPYAKIKGESSDDANEWYFYMKNKSASFTIETNYPLFAKYNMMNDYLKYSNSLFKYCDFKLATSSEIKSYEILNDTSFDGVPDKYFLDEGNFEATFTDNKTSPKWTMIITGSNKVNDSHKYEYNVEVTTNSTKDKEFTMYFPAPSIFSPKYFSDNIHSGSGNDIIIKFLKQFEFNIGKKFGNFPRVIKNINFIQSTEEITIEPKTVGIKNTAVTCKLDSGTFDEDRLTSLSDNYGYTLSEDKTELSLTFSPKINSTQFTYDENSWEEFSKSYKTQDTKVTLPIIKSGTETTVDARFTRQGLKYAFVVNNEIYIGENSVNIPVYKDNLDSKEYKRNLKFGIIKLDNSNKRILSNEYNLDNSSFEFENGEKLGEFVGVFTTLDDDLTNFQISTTEDSKIEAVFQNGEEKHRIILNLKTTPYINLPSSYYFQIIRTEISDFVYAGSTENLVAKVEYGGDKKECRFFDTSDPSTYGINGFFSPETSGISSSVLIGQDSYNCNKEKFQQMLYICNKDGEELCNSKITIAGIRIKVKDNVDGELHLTDSDFEDNKLEKSFTIEYDARDESVEKLSCKEEIISISDLTISTVEDGTLIITKNSNSTLAKGSYSIPINIKENSGVEFKYVNLNIIIE